MDPHSGVPFLQGNGTSLKEMADGLRCGYAKALTLETTRFTGGTQMLISRWPGVGV